MAGSLHHKPDHFQQQAIASTSRGIRIVAPAGSGKSETLARRVAKRIVQDGVDHSRILVLTFDNAAKKSLTTFFGALLDTRQMPQIRTLNSHGQKVLTSLFPKESATAVGPRPAAEVKALRDRYIAEGRTFSLLTWDGVNRTLLDTFAALKEQGFFPGNEGEFEKQSAWLQHEYVRLPGHGESAALGDMWGGEGAQSDELYSGQVRGILQAFAAFDAGMRDLGVMDFVDQKSHAVHQLWRSKTACTKLRAEFDEIVVDECQDISRLDAMLVYYTAGPETLVVLAGDDDQTLYEWRNAHSLYLRKPEMVFTDIAFETVHLNLNYRSPQEILGPAVRLISHNVERIEKSPSSGVKHPGEVVMQPVATSGAIEPTLIDTIRAEITAGRDPQDIAVLCHGRSDRDQKDPIERALVAAGIPVVVERDDKVAKPGVWVRGFLKAKGREWPVVIIPAANDRDVPDNDSIRKGEIESIRRRFYVAMTRASEKLVISYVRAGESDRLDATAEGEVIGTNGASRFLFEAGLVQDTHPAEVEEATAPVAPPVVETPQAVQPTPPPPPAAAIAPAPTPTPQSAPAPTPKSATPLAAPKRKGKLKDWEPRAKETQRMERARRAFAEEDYEYAVFCAWKPVELVLRRLVVLDRNRSPRGENVALIDTALESSVIDVPWKDRLHLWRQARNHARHEDDEFGLFTAKKFRDIAAQLVDGVPEFFAFLEQRHAPKQLALETQDEFVQKMSSLVHRIQQGNATTLSGGTLRAIRFHPERDLYDVLAFQLMMVLRDVRFYIPDEYRWSGSPIVNRFCVDAIGHLPQGFRPANRSLLKLPPGEELNQVLSRFDRIVQHECGDVQPGVFLLERMEDGLRLENGNFHAGIKINPRIEL